LIFSSLSRWAMIWATIVLMEPKTMATLRNLHFE